MGVSGSGIRRGDIERVGDGDGAFERTIGLGGGKGFVGSFLAERGFGTVRCGGGLDGFSGTSRAGEDCFEGSFDGEELPR